MILPRDRKRVESKHMCSCFVRYVLSEEFVGGHAKERALVRLREIECKSAGLLNLLILLMLGRSPPPVGDGTMGPRNRRHVRLFLPLEFWRRRFHLRVRQHRKGRVLTAFRIDGQLYVRVGEEGRPTGKARMVRVALWQSNCPDCGATFVQHHRTRAFDPAKRALRRCPACRKGPGKRVRNSRNGGSKFSPSSTALILSVPRQPSRGAGSGHTEPIPPALPEIFSGNPWAGQLSPPPRAAPAARLPVGGKPGVFSVVGQFESKLIIVLEVPV
jgi:hypothetical protein